MTLDLAIRHDFGGFDLEAAFTAGPGVTALFGPSGSGKTTIVNAVAGLLRPQSGHIRLDGDTLWDATTFLPPDRRNIGYVFQDPRLFPHMTVRRNLLYGAFFRRGRPRAKLDDVVDLLGALLQRRPGTLSGGEKSRVAIGRALLSAPRLLLLDEPLASLDAARKAEVLPYLETLASATGLPILYVSHSMAEVTRLATTLVIMEAGRVHCAGPIAALLPEAALGPEAGGLIAARVEALDPDGLTRLSTGAGTLHLALPPLAPGSLLRIRVEASDVILSRHRPEGLSALNILPVRVEALEQTPTGVLVRLACGDQHLAAAITRRSAETLALAPGLACHAIVKSAAIARTDAAARQ